jgi:hypothetical protein
MRKPQRITVTVPWALYQQLLELSDQEGRSLSSMANKWLERQAETCRRPFHEAQDPWQAVPGNR